MKSAPWRLRVRAQKAVVALSLLCVDAASSPAQAVAPAQVPVPAGRPRIGVALGGGGALGLSEIGVLRWMEDNHVPVDVIAGTSMGSLIAALYSIGRTPDEMIALTSDQIFSKVFRLNQDFSALNFRRREDSRFLPGAINIGLRHGVAIRNGVLLDSGLNEFLSAQFLAYGAQSSFDVMPLPFRCVATDILVGREAVFKEGPLAEAVRASISIPGVFPPLEDGGHIYVDGAITENLPVQVVKNDLHADVVLAVSLPLTAPDQGDTSSILGILQRSFSVASWSNEVRSRTLADVVIEPVAPPNTGMADYARSAELAKAGYAAAEQQRKALLPYRLDDNAWAAYLAGRHARQPKPVRNIATIEVSAPDRATAQGVRDTVTSLAGRQLDPQQVDRKLDEIRSDGRFDAVYYLSAPGAAGNDRPSGPAGRPGQPGVREILHPEEKRGPGGEADSAISTARVNNNLPPGVAGAGKAQAPVETAATASAAPMVLRAVEAPGYQPQPGDVDLHLLVRDKSYGPPFLLLGGDVIAQSGGTNRATVDAILLNQDLGGFRSELRTRVRFGFLTEVTPEYYRRLTARGLFLAPRLTFLREPHYIWANQRRVAERLGQEAGGGIDLGFTASHQTEFRLGWQQIVQRWATQTGSDGRPNLSGTAQLASLRYRFDGQDKALIAQHGLRGNASLGYLFNAVGSANAPRLEASGTGFRDLGHGNLLAFTAQGGTFFGRAIADPFRFTLGGPGRLSASAYEEYRGTDFFLLRPALLRRIASLPQPLGQSVYVAGSYEAGMIFAPDLSTVTRQDVFFGIAAETPLGAITFGPAIGDAGHRKLVFTLGRLF